MKIVFHISFPWGSFGHKMSELLSITITVSHGYLGCSWRSHLFVEIDSGRDKSDLEGMT
jgi:hypothetical protein